MTSEEKSQQKLEELINENFINARYELANEIFEGWTLESVLELANHSASDGWPGLTLTSNMVDLYENLSDCLWRYYEEYCVELGESPPMKIGETTVMSHDELCTFMAWFAAEGLAREIADIADCMAYEEEEE